MADRSKLRPVLIRKAGNALQVIPAHAAILGPELTFTRRVQASGWGQVMSAQSLYEDVQLYQISKHDNIEGDFLFAPAGLLNRVISALRKWGIDYMYEDVRPLTLEDPNWSAVSPCREGQDVILAKIDACDGGQIEAPTGEGKTWLIVQMCKMYSSIPIVIVVPSIDEAQTVRNRLLEALSSTQIGQLGGGKKQTGKRVTICVKNSLMHADLENCRLLLFDECHTAGSDVTSKTLMHADNCKRFGFTATPERRSDKADMVVEAIFGPVIHVTTYQESQERGNVVPITVIMRSVPYGPNITSKNSTVLNRNGIWRNEFRNRLIAQDIDEFTKNDEQLLVATDVVEHALEILSFHPGIQLVYSNMKKSLRNKYVRSGVLVENEHPITLKDRSRLQDEFQHATLRRVITTCWKRGVDFPSLQVLIRCDGSSSAINNTQLPGRLSRVDDGKAMGLLVDYLDEFNPTLHNRAKRRTRDYRSRGWTVIMPKKIGSS